ncbi:unnamed protein product [Lymnaea stagnalis]|uniref:G-protein coupled receptors family 1 profile domain-containing protein n=1 Tax=Lymnaea stagnalis TaxID=6523 RepID=A0AAV2I7R1_LYMST
MLFFISAVYVLSYLTSITLSVVRVAIPGVILSLNSGPQAVYSLFLLSYLVNSGVNPIFYSFYDRNFKKESKKMFKLITRRKNGCL